jgi:hypothetical protein
LNLEGPLQLITLLPLSIAAGVDLYLTLLLLGFATRLGFPPPPGDLPDLGVPAVLGMAALLYALERWVEGYTLGAVFWDAAHTVIRPLAGALLALMALAELPEPTRLVGAFAAAALTLATHVTRSGWGLLLTLIPARGRTRLLVVIAEDVGVLALLYLMIVAPDVAVILSGFVILAGLRWGASPSSAFNFSLRLLWDSFRALLRHRRWRGPERFPGWLRRTLDEPAEATGATLRGSPAGVLNLPGIGLFRRGWVVILGGSPVFLYRWRTGAQALDLAADRPLSVTPAALHNRVDMAHPDGRKFALYFSQDGPEPEDLRSQFGV